MTRVVFSATAALMLLAGGAEAQTTGAAGQTQTQAAPEQDSQPLQTGQSAPAPKSSKVSGVTVQGKRPDYRSSIDRRSYSLANDLQAANGSLSDALRNVPTLDVDPQGNLSIRGDQSVTILVDGQPSPMFNGPNRADLLQQLPANQYERVEVVTNPSAAFRPEGSGGVINLITKKNRGAQRTGSISAAASSTPRDRVSASGTLGEPKFTLNGVAFATRQASRQDAQTAMRLVDPASGQTASISDVQRDRQSQVAGMLYGNAAYTPDAKTRLDLNLRYLRFDVPDSFDGAHRSSATTGVLAQDFDYAGQGRAAFTIFGSGATYVRQLGGEDHEVSLHASYNDQSGANDNRQLLSYLLPVQPDLFEDLTSSQDQRSIDLKAEYKGPMPGQAKLTAGYELQVDADAYGHGGLLGVSPSSAAVDPSLADRFDFTQWVSDLYATYQRPIGHFDIMPGLRLEAVTISTDQLTEGIRGGQSYYEAFPTLHVDYALDQNRQLFASYSRRIQRPGGQQFDPFRVFNTPLSFTQGNARLAPAITASYEAGYEYTKGQTFLNASLYYKDAGNVVEDVVENLGQGVTLNSTANLGHTRNAGLELTAGGHITKTLSYSAGGDVSWNQISAVSNSFEAPRSGAAMFGHAKLNWTATPADFVQLAFYAHGRQINGQGSQASSNSLSLGYRHKFSDRLAAEVIVQDPFDDHRFKTFIDTPTLSETTVNDFHVRSIQIGLTYQLGAVRKQPQPKDFDFSGGAGGGGAGGGDAAPH
ncbi:MAG TPA: TonB-dependent receptor [Caulobacteraceae bacterium]